MSLTYLLRVCALALVVFAAAAPATSAFARHGADDPAGHDANDDRGDDGPGHY